MKTRTFALVILSGLLISCASTPPPYTPSSTISKAPARPRPNPSATTQAFFNPATIDASLVDEWISKAALLDDGPESAELLLRAAEVLLRDGEVARADDIVGALITPELNSEHALRLAFIRARVHRDHAEFSQALAQLSDPLIESAAINTPLRLQLQYSQMRGSLLEIEGDHLAAAQEWIFIDPLLTPDQQAPNREAIWTSLMQIPTTTLADRIGSTGNRDYLGWLELASIAKDNQGDIEAQVRQRDAWLNRWPNHPAHHALPGGLDKLDDLIIERPDQVALILPVTGRLGAYGKAIRDGFFAAYYEILNKGGSVPRINQYDSNNKDINAVYQQVVNDGNKLVIGPLEKESLAALTKNQAISMALPTLALNRIDGQHFPNDLYQFGLNPEDEAAQIADIALSKGYKRALIITPKGDWGEKVAQAFADRWQQLDGKIVASQTFDASKNNYSKQIKSILQINRSEQRLQRLIQIIGVRPNYQPYRRTDVDFIFVLARPNEGRAIKPLLAYHYASDIPVYATSHIYRGTSAPSKDQDINGVRFIDIPWVFHEKSEIRRAINAGIPSSPAYQRMYALGVDSFRLHLRLKQLSKNSSAQVFGETGTLSLNALKQIERKLTLAEIQNGIAVLNPLTTVEFSNEL